MAFDLKIISDLLSCHDRRYALLLAPVYDRGAAGFLVGLLHGVEFCDHAADRERTFFAPDETFYPLDIAHAPDNFSLPIEEAIQLRGEHVGVGPGQDRDVDGEAAVIAEGQFLARTESVLVETRAAVPG